MIDEKLKWGDPPVPVPENILSFDCNYRDVSQKPVIIWGLGRTALQLYVWMKNSENKREGIHKFQVIGFTDSYQGEKKEQKFCGKPVYTCDETLKITSGGKVNIVVATFNRAFKEEIKDFLIEKNAGTNIYFRGYCSSYACINHLALMREVIDRSHDKIEKVRKHLADEKSRLIFDYLLMHRKTNDYHWSDRAFRSTMEENYRQYFDESICPVSRINFFADCGSYEGGTSLELVELKKRAGGQEPAIYAFEPIPENMEILRTNFALHNLKAEIMDYAVFNCRTTVSMEEGEGSSVIAESGTTRIQTITLDEALKNKNVDFLKMDIEGTELEALAGAHQLIQSQKPYLAVCIYHNPTDLWEIPLYIIERYPWYELFIRHYSDGRAESVLYCRVDADTGGGVFD